MGKADKPGCLWSALQPKLSGLVGSCASPEHLRCHPATSSDAGGVIVPLRRRVAGALGLLVLLASFSASGSTPEETYSLEVEVGPVALRSLPLKVRVRAPAPAAGIASQIAIDGVPIETRALESGSQAFELDPGSLALGWHAITLMAADLTAEARFRVIPAWLSILPPVIAICLALLTKEVLLSLFCGVFAGALFLYDWSPFTAFARSVDHFIAPAVANPDQAAILVFTTLLGGMVGLINRSGGTLGIVDRLRAFATNAKRGQLATWVLGVLIFFDDYANTLIVGSTMRPITDKLRISREKLAYIVDSTAAPVASVFPISSWIGFEVGLIAAAFGALSLPFNPYTTFVASIPYRFYPIFALVLGFTIAASGRDFGPMLQAERRSRRTGKLLADGAVPLADFGAERLAPPKTVPRRAVNAFVPIAAVVVVTIGGMYVSGAEGLDRTDFPSVGAWLREVFGNANSYAALCWASLSGVALGLVLPLAQRIFTIREGINALVDGFKSVFLALIVLILAWSIGEVCDDLATADYVVSLTSGVLSPHWLPVLVFLLSAVVAFATGTSWGTLGILMPLVVPIANGLALDAGMALESSAYRTILVGTISSILAGSVWGDHCSPISDTTILSSTASGCDHIAHVRTQMPYALSVGILGMLVGDLPTAYGLSPWISITVGTAVIIVGLRWLGSRPEDDVVPEPRSSRRE